MEIGERQAKGNEKNLCLKGWETLVHNFTEKYVSKIYKSGQPHQNNVSLGNKRSFQPPPLPYCPFS